MLRTVEGLLAFCRMRPASQSPPRPVYEPWAGIPRVPEAVIANAANVSAWSKDRVDDSRDDP